MKLLSERNQVRDVARRWAKQYPPHYTDGDRTWVDEIQARLNQLDPETATAKEVAEIIGNTSWATEEVCDECGKRSWDVVQLGEKPDYSSSTAGICIDCLRKAVALVEASR
jgi:hypothetical protein